jgi:hypothetical protein
MLPGQKTASPEGEKLSTQPQLAVLPHYEAFRTEIRMPAK